MQVAFKGYEEARVALTSLLFTIPCCIIIGVEYGVFMDGKLKRVSCWCNQHDNRSEALSASLAVTYAHNTGMQERIGATQYKSPNQPLHAVTRHAVTGPARRMQLSLMLPPACAVSSPTGLP